MTKPFYDELAPYCNLLCGDWERAVSEQGGSVSELLSLPATARDCPVFGSRRRQDRAQESGRSAIWATLRRAARLFVRADVRREVLGLGDQGDCCREADGVVAAKQRARCRRIDRGQIAGCAPQYIRGLRRDLLVLQRATGSEAWVRRFASMISRSVAITSSCGVDGRGSSSEA
jgi:hypothetical protein